MEYRLVFEGVAANHIHVDVGAQPLLDLRMAGKKGHGALDLRSPDKAQSPFGPRKLAGID